MLKTGPTGGIIASGHALESPRPGKHWREAGKGALYFDISWDTILDPDGDEPLSPQTFTTAALKEFHWYIRGHGHEIPEKAAEKLEKLWAAHTIQSKQRTVYPDELPDAEYYEGAAKRIVVNAFERDPAARKACLKAHGYRCTVCELSFSQFYGPIGDKFIHVHHLRQLSQRGKRHKVDPIADLRPVCPNCHAMLHQPEGLLTVEQLQAKIVAQRQSLGRSGN